MTDVPDLAPYQVFERRTGVVERGTAVRLSRTSSNTERYDYLEFGPKILLRAKTFDEYLDLYPVSRLRRPRSDCMTTSTAFLSNFYIYKMIAYR